jgi:hypothetical protein
MKLAPESPKEVALELSEEISPELKELAPKSPHSSLLAGAMEIPSDSLLDNADSKQCHAKIQETKRKTCPMRLETERSKQLLCSTSQPAYCYLLIVMHPQRYLIGVDREKCPLFNDFSVCTILS